MTTLDAIRKGIRRGRRDREMTLDALAEASGVTRKALHLMEHPDKYPDYSPELDTVIRIVEDGFALSLCAFVCWVEGEEAAPVGLPEMPESLRRAARQAKTPPKGQPSEAKPAIHRGAVTRRLSRPR